MPKQPQRPDERLTAREREIQRLREFIEKSSFAGDEREATGELSTVDQHPADTADITFQRELDQTVEKILDQEESLIQDARARQAEGTYGICIECGRRIPEERLQARPQTIRCIDCQRRFESQL